MYDLAKNADSAEDIVKNFFDSQGDYITRMIAEDWAERITDLFKKSTGDTGSGGSNWAQWFGNQISAFGGGKASGGPVYPGMF